MQQNKWCLIVDDEPDICELVSDCMQENEFKTVMASDGQEALFKMEKQKFDLLITDLKMPKMNGIQLVEAIRQKRKKKKELEHYDFPIIIMSGDLQDFKSEMALIEDLHILEKPFSDDDLANVIEHLDSEAPIQKIRGNEPNTLFNTALQKFTDSVGIVCKQKAEIGETEAFESPHSLKSSVLISFFLKINGDDYTIHLGLSNQWAKQAAKVLSGGDADLPEERVLYVIRQLSSAIVNKVVKAFNQKNIATQLIDHTMFYNFPNAVYTRIDEGMDIFETPVNTPYGELQFFFSHPTR